VSLVLFDVDGTLVDAGGAGRWAIDRAFEKIFGLQAIDSKTAGVRFNGRTDPVIIGEIAAKNGIAPARLEERREALESAYLALLEERLAAGARPRSLPGVGDLLTSLEAGRIPFGLLTGNIRRGAALKLRSIGIDGRFTDGAFGSDHPDRAVLGRIARERFEAISGAPFHPHDVVVIGDAPEDVRAARANGYRALAVETGWTEEGELAAAGPDLLLADLSKTEEVVTWIRSPAGRTAGGAAGLTARG